MRLASSLLLSFSIALSTSPAPARDLESTRDRNGVLSPTHHTSGFGALRHPLLSRQGRVSLPPAVDPAMAQQHPGTRDETLRNRSAIDREIAELEQDLSRIETRGPRIASIVGGALTAAGVVVGATAGLACAAADAGSSTRCNTTNATALGIGGGIMALAGLITLVSGKATLSRRRRERSRIEQEIENLKRERSAVWETLDARLQLGRTTSLSLSWTF